MTSTPAPAGHDAAGTRTLSVLVYSDDVNTRESVKLAVGRRPAANLPRVAWTEIATRPALLEAVEPGLLFLPSRLVPPKGVQVALEAVAGLRDLPWRLVIAGDGWHRAALEEKARKLGVANRVQFLGEVSTEEIGRWYQRCEVVLFPVLRQEPFGLVGVEALSHGRPIVAFGGGGADEWLGDGESAVRVEGRTSEAFAAGLAGLLRDPARRLAMADGARRRYPPFEPDAYIARLVASFERAIGDFGIRTRPTG